MKENQLGQYLAILTSGLVNKPYLQRKLCFVRRIQIPSYTLIFFQPFSFSFQGLGLFANKDMEAVSCLFFFLLFLAWLVSLFVLQVILKFEDANDECLAYREVC